MRFNALPKFPSTIKDFNERQKPYAKIYCGRETIKTKNEMEVNGGKNQPLQL